MKRTTLGLITAIVVMCGVVTLPLAAPASAHAELESSSPADGAVLDALPPAVELVFGEELLPDTVNVSVEDGAGTVVRIAAPAVDGATITFPWPGWPGTPTTDTWAVNFRVVSQDGHPVSGTVSFTAPPPAAPVSASAPASSAPASSASAVSEASNPPPDDASSGRSWITILLIAAGLAAGIGIGMALVARRRTPS